MSAEIMAVSHRTNLLVTGDFNASISYHPPYTGSGIFRAAKPIGRELFTRFVTNNNLLPLNTFTNPLPTFISPTSKSQIDFVLQPAFQATQVKVLSQFPLGAWRAGGRHRPLATSIVPYAPWVRSPSFRKLAVSSSRRLLLAEHVRRRTPQAHGLFESVRRSIEAAKADRGLSFLHPDEVNTIMVEEASRISLHSPSRPEDIPTAQSIWQALRERRRIQRLRLANPASLRLIAAYASANRALKHASATHKLQVKEHRRQRTLSAVSEISLALMPNPRLSYHRLKVLAPWHPQLPICLTHPSGRVLIPEQGLHM